MLNFCTLFDSNYLHYGLCLHSSLMRHCKSFHLYIFAFDDTALAILNDMTLPFVTVISLQEFEDQRLLAIKSSRTKGEYCWTCTSSTILYVLNNFPVNDCTYIDSDLYFYSDPLPLILEMGEKSVSIISHRYAQKYDQSATSGKYCVQFMTFKNNSDGRQVLGWWRDSCIEWCYNRAEDGKFGDQKYLDDWLSRFDCVHEIENLGGGVAPWNASDYCFHMKKDVIMGREAATNNEFPVIFYHFHGFKLISRIFARLSFRYALPRDLRKYIYASYLKEMVDAAVCLKKYGFAVNYTNDISLSKAFKSLFSHNRKDNIVVYRLL